MAYVYLIAPHSQTPEKNRQLAAKLRPRILRKAQFHCQVCGFRDHTYGDLLNVHHIVPVERGGPATGSNLVALCSNCHRAVHAVSHHKFVYDGVWFPAASFEQQIEIVKSLGFEERPAARIAILASKNAYLDHGRLVRFPPEHEEPIETQPTPPCQSLMIIPKENPSCKL